MIDRKRWVEWVNPSTLEARVARIAAEELDATLLEGEDPLFAAAATESLGARIQAIAKRVAAEVIENVRGALECATSEDFEALEATLAKDGLTE